MHGTTHEGPSPGNLVALGFTPTDLISGLSPSLQDQPCARMTPFSPSVMQSNARVTQIPKVHGQNLPEGWVSYFSWRFMRQERSEAAHWRVADLGVETRGGSAALVGPDSAARFSLPLDWLGRGDLPACAEDCILLRAPGVLVCLNKRRCLCAFYFGALHRKGGQ